MWAENAYYGHRAALAAYAGVSAALPIPGRLQHGWQPGPGHPLATFADPGLHLVWSSRNVEAAHAAGVDDVVAIGAPWLYAYPEPAAGQGEGVLAMPFHGWERAKVAGDFERYADALLLLRERGEGDVAVCMYWAEFDDPALRAIFERRGFRTVTAGRRDDNPAFLATLRDLLAEHRLVTSNRIATATFYALASGRDFLLHGPVMGLAGSDDPDGSVFDRWQRASFPALCEQGREPGSAGLARRIAIGPAELGAPHVRSPAALRELLHWTPGGAAKLGRIVAQRQLARLRRALPGRRPR